MSIRYQDKLRKGASLDRSNFKKACPVLPLVPGYSAAKGLSWMVMPGWKQFFLGRWMWACTGSISITWVFVRKAHSEMPHPRPAESETLPDPPAIWVLTSPPGALLTRKFEEHCSQENERSCQRLRRLRVQKPKGNKRIQAVQSEIQILLNFLLSHENIKFPVSGHRVSKK